MSGVPKVAIVGGGVVGLTSALAIAQTHRSLELTVLADRDYADTTSWGPAGIFRPVSHDATIRNWSAGTFDWLCDVFKHHGTADTGVQLISGYIVDDDASFLKNEETAYGDMVFDLRWLHSDELALFPRRPKNGIFYTAFASEGRTYGAWLTKRLNQLGCRFLKRHVNALTDLSPEFDMVINCSGVEARTLVNDASVQPEKGVLVQIDAPWIRHFFYDGSDTHILPGMAACYLGGVRHLGDATTHAAAHDVADIWHRCRRSFPALAGAVQTGTWVGHRPARQFPRVEREVLAAPNGRQLKVVHNYGHRGRGFILSWGCAENVASLVEDSFRLSKL